MTQRRRAVAADQADSNATALSDLDDFFGLNPVWAPLHPLYQSGELALIHAAGSPDPSRSHFESRRNGIETSATCSPMTAMITWCAALYRSRMAGFRRRRN